MATMNISLPEPMRHWVEEQIESGLYSNNSDYVRDLIRKDQLRAKKQAILQTAIEQGIHSGIAEDFDIDKLQKELDNE